MTTDAERRVAEQDAALKAARARLDALLTPELRAALEEWHDAGWYNCVANSEGQQCCVQELAAGHETPSCAVPLQP